MQFAFRLISESLVCLFYCLVSATQLLFRLCDAKTGAKTIPLNGPALEVLANTARVEGNPYVIVGTGEGAHLTDLQKPWRRVRKAAGLEDVRIHDLRHTFASERVASSLRQAMHRYIRNCRDGSSHEPLLAFRAQLCQIVLWTHQLRPSVEEG